MVSVGLAHRDQWHFTTKMWAILDSDNQTVISCIPPDVSEENAIKEANGKIMIKMTVENSPGWIGAKYINGKFV